MPTLALRSSTTGQIGENMSALLIAPTLVEAASGTHARVMGVSIAIPTVTAGAASVTNGATLYIAGAIAPSGATNYALWVDAGAVQFDSTLTVGGILSVDDTTDSTSGVTGSIHTDGGLGVAKDLFALTLNAEGDTAAGDNAAVGYTATDGLILTGQGSTYDVSIKNDADALVVSIATGTVDVTLAGDLVVSGAGPHAIGGAVLNYIRMRHVGAFTSGGGGTFATKMQVEGTLTGATGDTTRLVGTTFLGSGITTQGATETITDVAEVLIFEPTITVGAGDTITSASSLKINSAPTEATNNYAFWVDAGVSRFDGTITGAGGTVGIDIDANGTIFIGDTANATMTIGLTINMAGNANQALCTKSSDVSSGLTTGTITQDVEVDDWWCVSKRIAASGGVLFTAVLEDANTFPIFEVQAYGGQASTTDTTTSEGLINLFACEHDGSNALVDATANSNVFTIQSLVSAAQKTMLLVKGDDGEVHIGASSGAGTVSGLDHEPDCLLVRGMQRTYGPAGLIDSPFEVPAYNHDALHRLGIVSDKDRDGFFHIFLQPLLRLHEGALWQLYTQHMDTDREIAALRVSLRETQARLDQLGA